MTDQLSNEKSMSETTDDRAELERLRERVRSAETREERREAIEAIVDRDMDRHAETYEKLAKE